MFVPRAGILPCGAGSHPTRKNKIYLTTCSQGPLSPSAIVNFGSQYFNLIYKDEDGKVSLDEFVTACLSQEEFTKMLAIKVIDIFVEDDD